MTTAGLELEEIHGPSALGGGRRRFFNLTWMVATSDFKLTYFGSVLGYLWSLMRPLLLFGVLYVVFSKFLRFGDTVRIEMRDEKRHSIFGAIEQEVVAA